MQDFLVISGSAVVIAIVVFIGIKLLISMMRKGKDHLRSLNMVFLKIQIPKKESKEDREEGTVSEGKDFKEVLGVAAHLFEAMHSIYTKSFKSFLGGQDFFSLEYVVVENQIFFYAVVPRELKTLIEKQITAFYPECYVEQVEDYNIFKPDSKFAACQLKLSKHYLYPIKTYSHLNSDPFNNITNVLSKLAYDDGAAIQIMIRPEKDGWQKKGREEAKNMFNQKKKSIPSFHPLAILGAFFDFFVRGEVGQSKPNESNNRTTPLTDEEVKALEEKSSKMGYETVIRIVTCAPSEREAKAHLSNIKSAFVQYSSPNANSFSSVKWLPEKRVVKDYILRSFHKLFRNVIKKRKDILSSDELASIFHLPNIRYNKAPTIAWQTYKIAPAPHNIPKEGLLLGYNT